MPALVEGLLGYTLAYAPLTASYQPRYVDSMSTVGGALPGYYRYETEGYLALSAQPGTQQLTACANDFDKFVSLDAACEGKTVQGALGQIWTQPPTGLAGQPLYRCVFPGYDTRTAVSSACGGGNMDKLLGYTLTSLPDAAPVFAAASGQAAVKPQVTESGPAARKPSR